jgi:coenzyme F420-0:L-glutamate ligase / coenzyme F420-1:gamma-L-glutamate ligase
LGSNCSADAFQPSANTYLHEDYVERGRRLFGEWSEPRVWLLRYDGSALAKVTLEIIPVHGLPEIRPGDDLVGLLLDSLGHVHERLTAGDVVVIAQKVVSKSEGRLVRLAEVVPSERARAMADESGKDPRQLEVVLSETKQILRWERGVLICETRHGFVCANAGVDRSNAGAPDTVVLLPVDPDASAARLRSEIASRAQVPVAVMITDTFGRAWREGHTNVAIGIAGLPALKRYIGQRDPEGYELRVTEIAVADEIAAAAELVMGKLDRCPVAIVRGLAYDESDETAQEYVRPAARDLFR